MKPTIDITLFYITFAFYFAGFMAFVLYTGTRKDILHKIGVILMMAGLLPHTVAFFARWQIVNYVPLSNMYEYMSISGWSAVIALIFIYYKYKKPMIGSLLSPLVFMLMVAAAILPKDVNLSLMPALQSVWLYIHVFMAAFATGSFLLSFGAAMIYLVVHYKPDNKFDTSISNKHLMLYLVAVPIGVALLAFVLQIKPPAPVSQFMGELTPNLGSFFILVGLTSIIGITLGSFLWKKSHLKDKSNYGGKVFAVGTMAFLLGSLIIGLMIKNDMMILTRNMPMSGGRSMPSMWMLFEFIGSAYLAGLILYLPVMSLFSQLTHSKRLTSINANLIEEISYKTVSIGYPLWTVGALFAGAIWAEQAWGAFWSWDPKEVGALIIWLFYSGYLHARLQHNWRGTKSAVLVIAGFLMVLLSFFGNYFFGGLHAYN